MKKNISYILIVLLVSAIFFAVSFFLSNSGLSTQQIWEYFNITASLSTTFIPFVRYVVLISCSFFVLSFFMLRLIRKNQPIFLALSFVLIVVFQAVYTYYAGFEQAFKTFKTLAIFLSLLIFSFFIILILVSFSKRNSSFKKIDIDVMKQYLSLIVSDNRLVIKVLNKKNIIDEKTRLAVISQQLANKNIVILATVRAKVLASTVSTIKSGSDCCLGATTDCLALILLNKALIVTDGYKFDMPSIAGYRLKKTFSTNYKLTIRFSDKSYIILKIFNDIEDVQHKNTELSIIEQQLYQNSIK